MSGDREIKRKREEVFHGHEDGALVSRARILMLDDDDLIQLITEVTGTGGISLHDNNGKVKRPQIANRLQQRELRLGELKLEQLQKIVAKEKWTGVSSYNWAKLMQFLTDNPQALPAPPKPNPNPTWKQQLKEAEDQGNLTLANCVSMLKRAGKLAAGSTVVYIIPPTVGGKNKLDNFAVLPKGLLADANGENAEAYCQLMAKILGTTMMKAAVDSCGGSFTGGSVDDLVRAWGERTKKAALHPWKGARNSTGGGGNGGGGNDHPRDQGRGPSPGAGGAAVPAGQRAGA